MQNLALACLTLITVLPGTSAAQGHHEQRAEAFRETFGLTGRERSEVPLQTVFDEHFVSARIGLFDLRVPAKDLTEKSQAKNLHSVVEALTVAQQAWIDWLGESVKGDAETRKQDFKLLEKELKRFRPDRLASSLAEGGLEYFALNQAKEPLVEAATRFAHSMSSGEPLGLAREADRPVQLVLFPKRKDFVEFVSFVGWQDPSLQSYYWLDGIETWNECYVGDTRFLCLQWAETGSADYTRGKDMNEKNPRELEQQVTQIAFNALFQSYYGERLPGTLIGGLSLNLVIDVFGEADTRLDGDLSSNETQAYERFIPGGRSEGGVLPENSADNNWRARHGADHFVRALRQSQKLAAAEKRGSDKHSGFLLKSATGSQTHVVRAPFFGAAAGERVAAPRAVHADWLELVRSYKSAFLFWLQTEAEGAKKSPELFGELLVKLAHAEPQEFESVVREVYGGRPLSSKELSKEDLEGDFLRWLATKR